MPKFLRSKQQANPREAPRFTSTLNLAVTLAAPAHARKP
jgi:hypothetical protein